MRPCCYRVRWLDFPRAQSQFGDGREDGLHDVWSGSLRSNRLQEERSFRARSGVRRVPRALPRRVCAPTRKGGRSCWRRSSGTCACHSRSSHNASGIAARHQGPDRIVSAACNRPLTAHSRRSHWTDRRPTARTPPGWQSVLPSTASLRRAYPSAPTTSDADKLRDQRRLANGELPQRPRQSLDDHMVVALRTARLRTLWRMGTMSAASHATRRTASTTRSLEARQAGMAAAVAASTAASESASSAFLHWS
jgi:hypothetical protein